MALRKQYMRKQVKFSLIQNGYLDDPGNTDNAWKEANVYLLLFECLAIEETLLIKMENRNEPPSLVWLDPQSTESIENISPMNEQLITLVLNHLNIQ